MYVYSIAKKTSLEVNKAFIKKYLTSTENTTNLEPTLAKTTTSKILPHLTIRAPIPSLPTIALAENLTTKPRTNDLTRRPSRLGRRWRRPPPRGVPAPTGTLETRPRASAIGAGKHLQLALRNRGRR